MVINVLLFLVMWAIGFVVFSFSMLQVLLVITAALPATHRFTAVFQANKKAIYVSCLRTIILHTVVSGAVCFLVYWFGSTYIKYGFSFGLGIAFLFSLGQLGLNKNNLDDYVDAYGKWYDPPLRETINALTGSAEDT